MSSEIPEAAARRSIVRRNRLIIAAFALAALVFIAGPFVVIWWGSRDFCPAEVTARGRSAGTDWEVTRSDCGAPVGIVWQVRIIPTKGTSQLAFDARGGGPQPVGYEQKGFVGTIALAAPPAGSSEPSVTVEIDHRGRPVAPLRFVDGRRVQ